MIKYLVITGLMNVFYFNYQISYKKILNNDNKFIKLDFNDRLYNSAISFSLGCLTVPYKIYSFLYEPDRFKEKLNKSIITLNEFNNYY